MRLSNSLYIIPNDTNYMVKKVRLKERVYLATRKLTEFGNHQPVVSLDKTWIQNNGWKSGDLVLIKVENLRGAKDIKVVR